MISKHISEEEIQLYVLEAGQVGPPLKQHLEECLDCQVRVKQYELLFGGIQSLSKPTFDFDVAALVMPQLEAKKKTSWYKLPLMMLSITVGIGLISIPVFLFSGKEGYSMNALLRNISPWVLGIISIVAVGLIAINVWDAYMRYRHQLDKLNFQ